MISKRDVLIELLWLVGILIISFVLIFFLKQNIPFFKDGDINLHDTYFVIDNSYLGILSILFVPFAYLVFLIKVTFSKLVSILSILVLLILNVLFIAFNTHYIAIMLLAISVSYFPKESSGWAIHPPLKEGSEFIANKITGTYFDNGSIYFWYSTVLFVLCLSLIYFSYQLASKVKRYK